MAKVIIKIVVERNANGIATVINRTEKGKGRGRVDPVVETIANGTVLAVQTFWAKLKGSEEPPPITSPLKGNIVALPDPKNWRTQVDGETLQDGKV